MEIRRKSIAFGNEKVIENEQEKQTVPFDVNGEDAGRRDMRWGQEKDTAGDKGED